MKKHKSFYRFVGHLYLLTFFALLTDCKKPVSTSNLGSNDKLVDLISVANSTVTAEGYPIVQLPAGADTSSEYWKGVDLSPQAPVLAQSVKGEQSKFILKEGYRMDPVLVEPQIEQPAAISFDGNGRMYVLELRSYMLNADSEGTLEPVSGISRWEDKDNDGVYETGTMFVDKLVFPRFVLPFGPDAILTMESNQDVVYKFSDTDGDGIADKKEFFTNNYGRSGNVEHQQASLYYGMDNWLYSTVNAFRVRWTPDGVLREPTGRNKGQWGVTHDDDGKMWFQGGASGIPSHFQYPIHLGDYGIARGSDLQKGFTIPFGAPIKLADFQPGMPAVRLPEGSLNRVTGSAGNDVYRGDRLPKELYGQYFYGEPVARIVRQVNEVRKEGLSELQNVYQEDESEFIISSDPLFRPVDITTAPDGSMYITDMYRGIIQEGQWTPKGSYLRAKVEQYQLDKIISLGRIWRLSYDGMERDKVQPRMFDETSAELVGHLEHPNGWWRDKAQQLLVLRQDKSVVSKLEEMVRSHFKLEPRFHALWVLEGLGELKPDLVREMMKDPHYRMRIMAMYVSESLYKGGDKTLGEDFLKLANDENVEVKMRALMTGKMLKIDGILDAAIATAKTDTAAGVKLVTSSIINPQETRYSTFGMNNSNFSEEEKVRISKGQKVYQELCSQCHGNEGRGTPVGEGLMAPSFVNNNNLKGHSDYVVKTILRGLTGKIEEKSYEGVIMVPMAENSDEWVSSVASFIRLSFDNNASFVSSDDVARVRTATEGQAEAYLYRDLKSSVPMELMPTDGWEVTASHAIPVRKGGTGKAKGALSFEGWSTGLPQSSDMWFQVEFPESVMVSEIQFKSEGIRQGSFRERLPSIKTHPRQLIIETSKDGKKWKEVFNGPGADSPNMIRLSETKGRFLRMRQTGSDEKATWAMSEMKLYGKTIM
ncbi:MAG: mono/diheme cytochrome c family protein [Arcticibacterium sp.]|jgi:mono/diheme cytochrome c family protein